MKHATHMQTPYGYVEIPPWTRDKFPKMTDREIVNAAINNGTRFINPEYFAELLNRGLAANGAQRSQIFKTLEQREAQQVTDSLNPARG